jgi:hypothetical protein
MGQLVDAWKKLQMDMEVARLHMQIDTQQKILEAQKSIRDKTNVVKDDKNNSDMLTIQNIGKIIGKSIPMSFPLRLARIEDVYGTADTYAFKVKIETPNDTKHYILKLNREKIPYPQPLHNGWELYYERRPNQSVVEALDKEDLRDMGEVIRRISNLMDRILNP